MIHQRNAWTFTDGRSMPMGTMYCIGRNYAAHAKEMNAEVSEKPLVFLKPPTAYLPNGGVVAIPSWSHNIHHEVEMVVVVGAEGVAGIGVGLDLTARDVQSIAKQRGEPWAVAKGFRGSAPVSEIVHMSAAGTGPWNIDLTINGELRQQSSTSHMERSIEELIAYVDDVFGLQEGDCIFTGTPEGVARCVEGDVAVARISNGQSDILASLTISFA